MMDNFNRNAVLMLGLISLFVILGMSVANCQVDSNQIYNGPMAKAPDTCLNVQTIISTATQLKELRARTATQGKIIEAFEQKVDQMEILNQQNESIIKLQEKEIEIYSNITDRFVDVTNGKTPWYRSNEFHFISGFIIGGAAIYLGARSIR